MTLDRLFASLMSGLCDHRLGNKTSLFSCLTRFLRDIHSYYCSFYPLEGFMPFIFSLEDFPATK
jgi:hypothetical protein